ncbi:Glycoside hydrolase, 38 vacuolar alpha mannosidase [Saitoella coloradoensis]
MGGERFNPSSSAYPTHSFGPNPSFPKIHNLDIDHLRAFTANGGQFEDCNLPAMMYDFRSDDEKYIQLEVWSAPFVGVGRERESRPSFDEAMKRAEWRNARKGERFGPSWSTHWFRITLRNLDQILPHPAADQHLELHFDCEGEGAVYTPEGLMLQGLTGGGGGDRRVEFILPEAWWSSSSSPTSTERIIYIEAAMNGMFGVPCGDQISPPDPNRYFELRTADIVVPNMTAWRLFWDYTIIADCARELGGWEGEKALGVATKILGAFRRGERGCLEECRDVARVFLGRRVDGAEVYRGEGGEGESLVFGIGHCHIDTAWLWPFAETRRKIARSWSTQIDLIKRYPEHRFTASSAQQYAWLKEDHSTPGGLYHHLRETIHSGAFTPIGGTWVECDTNMPSGESLCRQFLLGQRFFEREFGIRCRVFWLPDTFGYSSQLPQLCRLSGMKYFFTQKLSWNNINKFVYTSFNWVGIDGSQILCHMTPSETYNAQAHVGDLIRSVTQHKNKGEDPSSLLVFGNGDGGGGPLAQMLEKLRRCRGVSDTVGRLPRVSMGGSVDQFYERLEERTEEGKTLPNWVGELYFELHRGTYTSQAKTKKGNRLSEFLMRDVEFFASLATIYDAKYEYPKKEIDECWQMICLCQFHDVLPGSAIEMVFDDAATFHAQIWDRGQRMLASAFKVLGISSHPSKHTALAGVSTVAWPRTEVVEVEEKLAAGVDKSVVFEQQGGKKYVVLSTESTGVSRVEKKEVQQKGITKEVTVEEVEKGIFVLENGVIRVRVENGHVTSLYDVELDREIVAKNGKAGRYVIYDDQPLYWDAWDVEVYHLTGPRTYLDECTTTIVGEGPLRASLLVESKISEHSWIKTTISLDAVLSGADYAHKTTFEKALPMLNFDVEVEWQESRKFLKVEFPTDILCDTASYETQFGINKRPTHFNTSWDAAKFEVVCHKWADLSEHGYGLSILNDSKYGFATHGSTMRLSLLRSPKAPDAHADMGRHHFRYAMLPHRGNISQAAVVRAGYNFNNPLRLRYVPVQDEKFDGLRDLLKSIWIEGADNVVLDTIKRAEDGADVVIAAGHRPTTSSGTKTKSIVVRLYEAYGGKTKVKVMTTLPVVRATEVNILEDELSVVDHKRGRKDHVTSVAVDFTMGAFEVKTLKLELSW